VGAGILVLLGFGCRDEVATHVDRNLPPDTYLTGVPADSTTSFYKVHLFWYGGDADGKVVGYEFVVTDSLPVDEDTLTYRYTTRTDSLIIFPVGSRQQVLGHRFYVRAIDNDGAVDPEPAIAFFGALDLIPPSPVFTLAEAFDPESDEVYPLTSTADPVPTDTVPSGWDVRFRWRGVDGDRMLDESGDTIAVGEIVRYEYWLAPVEVEPNVGDVGDTVAVYGGLSSGKYQFTLRGVDDAGFMGVDPAVRTFVWNHDPQTYFARGWNEAQAESMGVFKALSNAWQDTLVFFEGDTVPLIASVSGRVEPVTILTEVSGWDPDGEGPVSGFQYRLGPGVWQDVSDPERRTVEEFGLTTTYKTLYARCADELGRRDGTPAQLRIQINRAPRLLDTLDVETGRLQYPRPYGVVPLDSILAWGDSLKVNVRAWDPDSTTRNFFYGFRYSGYLFEYENSQSIRGIRELKMEFAPLPGEYTLDVLITEDARGVYASQQHEAIRQIQFLVQ
jgi:hypothetical protein